MKNNIRARLLFILVLLELVFYLLLNYRSLNDCSVLLYFQYLPAIFMTVWWGWVGLLIPVLLLLFYIYALVFGIVLPIDYFSLIDILFFIFFVILILIIRTNWQQSNLSLKKEKERLKIVSEITSDYYFYFDLLDFKSINLDTKLNWNTDEICGYDKKEINTLSKCLSKFREEDQKILLDKFLKLEKEKSFTHIFLCTRKDQEKIWIKGSFKATRKKVGYEVFVVMQDITNEKNVDILKTEFISMVSHQLREPLSVINWHSELLLDGTMGKVTKKQKDFLEIIYATNKRMKDLINSFLNFSKLELGKLDFVEEEISLNNIIKEAVKDLDYQLKNKKIKTVISLDKSVPKINFDSRMFYIVINNLITNALKYTPEGGDLKISTKLEEKNILIEVTDTGYGIPKQDQAKIFQRMHRGRNVKAEKIEGIGIGLYLTKAILNYKHAKISFESKEGKGTTFLIKIPFKK